MSDPTQKPETAEACYNLAMSCMGKSDWDGAIIQFNRAIELNPNFGEAYGNRGASKNVKGDADGALADLEKAIELKPDVPGFKHMLKILKRKRKADKPPSAAPNTGKKKIPATENALALRTDFSDEAAWKSLCTTIQDPKADFVANVDFISDPEYDGLTADQLPSLVDSSVTFAFIIDRMALTHPEHPVLVIDLHGKHGRTFRVIPSALWAVENNLSIANMDFEEFADAVDENGIFRGP
jgi:tetratricopeptide (TPR) repeat protein